MSTSGAHVLRASVRRRSLCSFRLSHRVRSASWNARVVAAIARLFAAERKADKARKWFSRAATLDRDLGDVWAAWHAFEVGPAGGGPEHVRAVEEAVAAAEPAHGEAWQAVAKAPENRKCSKVEVLRMVAAEMARVKVGGAED